METGAEEGEGLPLLLAENLVIPLRSLSPLRIPRFVVPPSGFVAILADAQQPLPARSRALLETLSGDRRPAAGRIVYRNQDLAQSPAGWAKSHGLSLLGSGTGYEPAQSVEANLLRSAGSALPDWLFCFLPLEERLSLPAGRLSPVERRWLALACVLAPRPRLLLLDRPLEGLPPLPRQALLERLVRLNLEEGIAFCLTAKSNPLIETAAASTYRIASDLLIGE